MDKEEILENVKKLIKNPYNEFIPCCEDDTRVYHAYNNIESIYDEDSNEYENINIFKKYINMSFDEMAEKLDVDKYQLEKIFNSFQTPSLGLSIALGFIFNIEPNELLDIIKRLGYKFNDGSFIIMKYFIENHIYDIELLNEALVSNGFMYLYSKKRLR